MSRAIDDVDLDELDDLYLRQQGRRPAVFPRAGAPSDCSRKRWRGRDVVREQYRKFLDTYRDKGFAPPLLELDLSQSPPFLAVPPTTPNP